MRDSNYCYWHHKARARRRRSERIGGPISMEANTGLDLPLLEDANAIQVAIQEIMHAILDRRIDAKRAGLLLYSLQLASSNLHNLHPMPLESEPLIASIGSDDEEVFNDTIAEEEEEEPCDGKCDDCAEEDCDDRKVRAPKVHTRSSSPRKPPTRVTQPPGSTPVPALR